MKTKAQTGNFYSSIRRNFDILRALADGINRFDDIKAKVDLPASTINRILKGLVIVGLAYQDPATKHYYLGPEIINLSADPLTAHQMLVSICQGELERLSALSGETTVLFLALGIKRITLFSVPSPHEMTLLYKPGLTSLIHLASGGKMLLAMMDWARIENILDAIELILKEDGKELKRSSFLKELKEIKKQGYATARGEWLEGCNGFSVPLWGYSLPAALGMMAPDYRVDTFDYRDEILESGRRVSKILSQVFPPSGT